MNFDQLTELFHDQITGNNPAVEVLPVLAQSGGILQAALAGVIEQRAAAMQRMTRSTSAVAPAEAGLLTTLTAIELTYDVTAFASRATLARGPIQLPAGSGLVTVTPLGNPQLSIFKVNSGVGRSMASNPSILIGDHVVWLEGPDIFVSKKDDPREPQQRRGVPDFVKINVTSVMPFGPEFDGQDIPDAIAWAALERAQVMAAGLLGQFSKTRDRTTDGDPTPKR